MGDNKGREGGVLFQGVRSEDHRVENQLAGRRKVDGRGVLEEERGKRGGVGKKEGGQCGRCGRGGRSW